MKNQPPTSEEIITNKWLVEFDRKPLDKYPVFGFLLALTDEFTLIQEFDRNTFLLESYSILINKDVRKFAVYDSDDCFLSEVIRTRNVAPEPIAEIDLSDWPTILRWVSQNYGFFVIETERLHKDKCYVGVLDEIRPKTFVFREIDTDANWWPTITKFKYKDITKIKFGGPYETTLGMVVTARE